MTTKRYAVANWKSHKTTQEALQWLKVFLDIHQPVPNVQVIIAPSFVSLEPLKQLLLENNADHIALAAQDLSPFPMGAYTGAVSAAMVQDLVDYAFIGHSERRRYFHETDQEIANKVTEALSVGITPILCMDLPYIAQQIAALTEPAAEKIIIGYGPVEAIGIDIPQSISKVTDAVQEISSRLPGRPILYGGSLNAGNGDIYMNIDGLNGLMAGSASLDPKEFTKIINAVG